MNCVRTEQRQTSSCSREKEATGVSVAAGEQSCREIHVQRGDTGGFQLTLNDQRQGE